MFELPIYQISTKARSGPAQRTSEAVDTLPQMGAILGCIKFHARAVPYAVGLVITAGYWWTSSISFANPALPIARGFSNTFAGGQPADITFFIIAQCIAADIALRLFRWLFSDTES